MKELLASILAISILLGACYQKTDIPDTPQLSFVGMNKDQLYQGFSKEDSIIFILELLDGDGDIGFEETDNVNKSIIITDLRTGNVAEEFRIPVIPENVVSNGLQAEMQLTLYTTCCLFPDNIPPCSTPEDYPLDTLTYEIVVIDRAGNQSEAIITPPIILICD